VFKTVSRRSFAAAFAFATVVALGACGDDPAGPEADAILGSWQVTSFIFGEDDLVNDGMDLDVIFNSDGTYRFEVTNDQVNICDDDVTGLDCTEEGSFAYTATTVTFDDDVPEDSVTFTYSITGAGNNFMSWTTNIEGLAVEVALQRS